MPEKGRRSSNASHEPPPTLIVSRYPDRTDTPLLSPASTYCPSSRERSSSDSDRTSTSRRRHHRNKQSRQGSARSTRSGSNRSSAAASPDSSIGRFLPRLSRILEIGEPSTSVQTEPPRRRHRPLKHRVGHLQRRGDTSLLRASPSLLSVLSGFTGVSDRSSGSNSTITQQSYDQQAPKSSTHTSRSAANTDPPFNVFDYMMPPTMQDRDDARSIRSASTSSSRSAASTADSSDIPGTPSSRSTAPSQAGSRKSSISDYRAYSDTSYAKRQPSVADVDEEDDDEDDDEDEDDEDEAVPSQRMPMVPEAPKQGQPQLHPDQLRQQQEEMRRQHLAYTMHAQQTAHRYEHANYGVHRSGSMSSTGSDPYTAYHMAMQQYQHQAAPPNGTKSQPTAPEVPDLSLQTLTGYEMIAKELSADTDVKPLYRKFDYLNHRILLHLQDELCELEEQLRVIDEVIAQLDSASSDEKKKAVASRRADAWKNSEIHRRRTELLGRIFMKTEQYNRAMTSYATLCGKSTDADEDQVHAYRKWMVQNAPIHENETRFLERGEDLILPGIKKKEAPTVVEHHSSRQSLLAYLPVALMLPLLLYSIIPSVTGRLIVTAFVAGGALLVASATELRTVLPLREWAICGAAYVLVMAAIAGCIPTHSTVITAPSTPLEARYTVKR